MSLKLFFQWMLRPLKEEPLTEDRIKRYCLQKGEFECVGHSKDIHGLVEYTPLPWSTQCKQCDPQHWVFNGSQYSPYLTEMYAQKDGCLPSFTCTKLAKFIIPWKYRNKLTGQSSWKIYHLKGDEITGAESEIIVVNPYRDQRMVRVLDYVANHASKYAMGKERIEFLLKVIRNTLGQYGCPKGPTSQQADEALFNKMKEQGHNFVHLCEVPIGVCRHKSLLFKILCDALDIPCALVTGYSTAGRHQWNIVTLPLDGGTKKGDFLIDATSKSFTWTTPGSMRVKGYRIQMDESLGHAGFTQRQKGIL